MSTVPFKQKQHVIIRMSLPSFRNITGVDLGAHSCHQNFLLLIFSLSNNIRRISMNNEDVPLVYFI